jgi:hypothetical protein
MENLEDVFWIRADPDHFDPEDETARRRAFSRGLEIAQAAADDLAICSPEHLRSFAAELEDQFGKQPLVRGYCLGLRTIAAWGAEVRGSSNEGT